ncbi:MAG TPA: AAA family ATPase, partial [Rubrobacter sp.]|nr:AAA family ATPase [Rubrobacter sp.]
EERSARTDLRSILTSLRKTMEQGAARGHGGGEGIGLLASEGDLLGVEARGVELDLRSLEAAVSLARRETPDTSPMGGGAEAAVRRRGAIARLEGAREAYRGEFMEGFSLGDAPEFELWLEAERARWRGVFGELCERLSQLQVETGRLEVATETARLWVRHAPYEEAAHSRLVEILSAAGDPEGAILAFEGFRSGLRRELGIDPSPRMTKLAGGLREEVEERRSLGSILARSAAAPLSRLEVPFAGRRDEFGALVSEYHATRAGETRAVAVIGEPGIGKTRLAEEFIVWTRARGADVLQGAASEGAGLPYGPLLEAIRPRMERERAPDDLLEDAWLSELSRLLPELKERYPDLPSAPSGEGETAKGALFEAIVRTVEALASRAPVVFFLDDLQWADATTLEVLDYAGGRWAERGAPVLMLLAARAEEPESGSPLDGWLHALQRRLPLGRLALGPLENEDVTRMLRRMAKPDYTQTGSSEGPGERMGDSDRTRSELDRLGEWLTAETRGQPFYFVETLKALLEEGKLMVRAIPDGGDVLEISSALRAEDASTAILPQSVREVIR